MMKYKILMFYPLEGPRLEEVRGFPVTIPWLKGVTLFAHHPYVVDASSDTQDRWNISEAKSGLALITYSWGTKKQAVDALMAKLVSVKSANISKWLKEMIDKNVKEYGVANKPPVLGGKG